ncbi:MAG: hypothetical protein FE039_00995 [Thermoplasmata archaeon]|nr:MAG: hypothetical protein FE039_00995 [Thermoplasmata archaeon]
MKNKEKEVKKYGFLIIFATILGVFSWLFHEIDPVVGFAVLILVLILWIGSWIKIWTFSDKKQSHKLMIISVVAAGTLMFIVINTLPYKIYDKTISLLLVIIICLGVYGGLAYGLMSLIKERRIPLKKIFYDKDISSNILYETRESRVPPKIEKEYKKMGIIYLAGALIVAVIGGVIITAVAVIYPELFEFMWADGIIFLMLIVVAFFCLYFIHLSFRSRKILPEMRRKIILTDKEIQIPIKRMFLNAVKATPPVPLDLLGNMAAQSILHGGYIKYKDVVSYSIDWDEEKIILKTKNFELPLYLTKSDIKNLIKIIDEHRAPSTSYSEVL